jgi:hypothetical protein
MDAIWLPDKTLWLHVMVVDPQFRVTLQYSLVEPDKTRNLNKAAFHGI